MDTLKSLVQPLIGNSGGSSIVDGMKLVVLGGTVETARRVSSSACARYAAVKRLTIPFSPFVAFFLTAHFSEEDFPYEWLMLWLSRRPEWQRSREFETTTRASGPGGNNTNYYSEEDADWDRWERAESDGLDPDSEGRPRTRVMFQPTYDTTHTIFYRGHWLRIRRGRKQDTGSEMISISVVARSNAILKQLVLQAKREYEAEAVHRIQIYFADAHGSWRWTDSRHKRPLSSIVLNPGVKEMLVDDARDFLKSEKWYADRGIPFRRGYLLHGVPGSGKSSLIHALAGQLQLDIYVVSLSASWISDNTLTALMGRVPARCVLLLEDLDAAFLRSTNREEDDLNLELENGDNQQNMNDNLFPGFSNGLSVGYRPGRRRYGRSDGLSDMNTLSLSGLLNALDGVAASEGRLLFATTNHLDRLDPALCRPGRLDVWVEFKNASKWQAEALFRNFFPCEEEEESVVSDADLESLNIDANVRTYVPSNDSQEKLADSRRHSGVSNTKSGAPSLWSLSTNIASSASSLISGSIPSSAMDSGVSSPTLISPSDVSAPPLPRTFSGPPVPDEPTPTKAERPPMDKNQFGADNTAYLPPPPDASLARPKPLDRKTLAVLAKRFADGLPEEEFSVASLQGYLLKHKAQPDAAANGVVAWVLGEREMREKLKKEREAREVKLKALREKRRKEAQEKEKQKKAQDKKEQELEKVKKLLAEKEKEEELEKMRQQLKEKEEERRKKRKEKKKGKGKEEKKEKESSGSESEDEKEKDEKKDEEKTKEEEKEKDTKEETTTKSKKKAKKEDKVSDDKKDKKKTKDDAKKDESSSSSSDSDDKEDEAKKPAEADETLSTSSADDLDPSLLPLPPAPQSKWGRVPDSDEWSSSDSGWGR
ncbi:hypothetical protein CVT26_000753 [Gymnopilus dilepis]|uniref:AAA+ ATPase domain-containing protein n=1 Tax=Gymnopilus dilepis TaxID=231916 RepID=A0A409Y2I3_9AGAR|nr:hypothetical protein CVT26_000753 [Gymnopilus dilepis]